MLIEVSELGVGRRDPRTQTGLNNSGPENSRNLEPGQTNFENFGSIRSDPRIWRTVDPWLVERFLNRTLPLILLLKVSF